ncbi:protein of unknown function [Seinonella peptonophila]|uniref:DUF4309 domain-containing protein n=1 Tax=Seinonella peptonophila TaxID=112248 RepID=A0A1M4U3I9_9BACL|nr:DUF4309 domain-containing protein [Seinonella peptonophila]SHE51299.1 protein of unknown function [Seinonella peptonophila]
MKKILFCMALLLLAGCQSSPQTNEKNKEQTVQKAVQSEQKDNQLSKEQQLLKQITQKAEKGILYGVEKFPIGTPVETVLHTWGTPEGGDPGYLDYKLGHQCGLVAADTKQLTGITSYHADLLKLTADQVKKVLGQPEPDQSETSLNGTKSLLYKMGKYRLFFYYSNNQITNLYLEEIKN